MTHERWCTEAIAEDSKVWEPRSEGIAKYIKPNSVVLDVGCGVMSLEKYLPEGCRYLPCDIVSRDERTQVVDLNKGEFPDIRDATIITLIGVLEYITDLDNLFRKLKQTHLPIILTYTVYHPVYEQKNKVTDGWVNHLKEMELQQYLDKHGFFIEMWSQSETTHVIKMMDMDCVYERVNRWSDKRMAKEGRMMEHRSSIVASLIKPSSVVLDMGCGAMGLEKHLPKDCQYVPCDLKARDKRTLVADFNKGEFPQCKYATVVTLVGVLEHLNRLDKLFENLQEMKVPVIFSYPLLVKGDMPIRRKRGWLNHLTEDELKVFLESYRMTIIKWYKGKDDEVIVLVEPTS